MNRKLASSFSVFALGGGVAALVSGLAIISSSVFSSWDSVGTGAVLILTGFASWIAGVRVVKGANRARNIR
ncbi:MAG: hypothetical protein ACKVP5_17600 [Aestuariivirga sp.]